MPTLISFLILMGNQELNTGVDLSTLPQLNSAQGSKGIRQCG